MRVDIITIFPTYFDPLELSVLGRARAAGVLDLHVHDLRAWTHDRHRTIDDTPYGGGAGMVMRPEPWGEALDAIVGAAEEPALIVFPTPAGGLFRQDTARSWSDRKRIVFACGRYEGIDDRVMQYAASLGEVREVSIGDYVLAGGEVAALTMIEAVGRLLPGVLGNPDSLVEESHENGLLEYPAFTKPPRWRGYDVPPVLLSGDHAAIASWRRRQQEERTRARRPDLLAPSDQM
jgi:tRNA (guanine37-N1)-methyltransferase